jgi:molecular chaperone GrpE
MPKHDHPTPDHQPPAPTDPAAAEAAAAAADTVDPDTLRAERDDATRQAEEYLKLAQRTQADFVNYRRRVEEERAQQAQAATQHLILKLLGVLDDFERARAGATPQDLESAWGKGVELVERNLRGILAAEGVERIAAEDAEFNPWEHEAVSSVPAPGTKEGHVLQVVRAGYRKGDRVIRPAQVVVAARAEDSGHAGRRKH